MAPRRDANPLHHVDARVRVLRVLFRTLGPLAPETAARAADELFCRPPRHAMRPHEELFLASGERFEVPHRDAALAAWRWPAASGAGAPVVVLVHGWGSRAGRFSHFVPALRAAGFACVAYDGPAHGRSPWVRASLPEFADALRAVADAVGPVAGYVGHSLGGAAAIVAQGRGAPAAPTAAISAPADPQLFTRRFARHVGLPPGVEARLDARLRRRLGVEWEEIHVPTHAARLAHPLLVVHDADDRDVPLRDGEALAAAAPVARLVRTQGLGHRAVMRDAHVVRTVADFLMEQAGRCS